MQHLLAETRTGPHRLRDRHARACSSTSRDAGLKVLNGTDLASRAEVVVVGRHRRTSSTTTCATRPGGRPRRATCSPPRRDPTYPKPDGLWPGTGAILAAVEYATGRSAPRSSASPSRSCS